METTPPTETTTTITVPCQPDGYGPNFREACQRVGSHHPRASVKVDETPEGYRFEIIKHDQT